MPQDIVDGRIDEASVARVTDEDAERLARYRVRSGDIVYSRRGDIRRRVLIRGAQEGWLCGTGCLRVRIGRAADASYLAAYLGHPSVQAWIERHAVGATMPNLNTSILGNVPVALPPISEQQRIAAVLGALDDKIDSNRRLAGALEETAAALFRARFIDFLGVEDLRDTEAGPIPRGWKQGSLADLAKFVNGKAFTKDANGEGRPILRIKELKSGVGDTTPWTDITAPEENVARHHDILFAWSGSLDVYRWSGPEAVINQHIFKVVPNGYPAWFVFRWIHAHMPGFQAIARDKATTMGHIQRRHLAEAPVPIPDPETLAAARDVVDPLDAQTSVLAAETMTLTAVRDALLPRLVSGVIRVPETDDPAEIIEPAALRVAAEAP